MEENGWLIETRTDAGGALYWTGRTWSKDSLEGIRYAREVDALRVIHADPISFNGDLVRVERHVWTGINPPEDSQG